MGKTKSTKSSLNVPKSKAKSNDQQDFSSLRVVLFYCLLIILLPIITFFFAQNFIFDKFLSLSDVWKNIWSAIMAVIALHVALFMYVYRAYFGSADTFNDDDDDDKED